MDTNTKQCKKCKEIKDLTCFSKSATHKDGHYHKCKQCRSALSSEWNKANRERTVNNSLIWKYGITLERYKEMLIEQNNKCACCNRTQTELVRSLSVDHCHATGKVRGLLCDQCNNALGLIRENIETAERITQYLKDHNGNSN